LDYCRTQITSLPESIERILKSNEESYEDSEEDSEEEPVSVSNLTPYAAKLIVKANIQENNICPIQLEPLDNFKSFLAFSCGHVCSYNENKINSCPSCRKQEFPIKIDF
jgi:hypothetical protein